MALDVGIKAVDGADDPLERDLVVHLTFPYFGFLTDHFAQFAEQTGIDIVPYDDAFVAGKDLETLDQHVELALRAIAGKPDRWDEHVGFQTHPRQAIYEPIDRLEFQGALVSLRRLIHRAVVMEKVLMFFGD